MNDERTVACNYARQLDTLRNVILDFSPSILSHQKNIPSIIVPTARGGTTRETFTQREQRLEIKILVEIYPDGRTHQSVLKSVIRVALDLALL